MNRTIKERVVIRSVNYVKFLDSTTKRYAKPLCFLPSFQAPAFDDVSDLVLGWVGG